MRPTFFQLLHFPPCHPLTPTFCCIQAEADLSQLTLFIGDGYEISPKYGMLTVPWNLVPDELPRKMKSLLLTGVTSKTSGSGSAHSGGASLADHHNRAALKGASSPSIEEVWNSMPKWEGSEEIPGGGWGTSTQQSTTTTMTTLGSSDDDLGLADSANGIVPWDVPQPGWGYNSSPGTSRGSATAPRGSSSSSSSKDDHYPPSGGATSERGSGGGLRAQHTLDWQLRGSSQAHSVSGLSPLHGSGLSVGHQRGAPGEGGSTAARGKGQGHWQGIFGAAAAAVAATVGLIFGRRGGAK